MSADSRFLSRRDFALGGCCAFVAAGMSHAALANSDSIGGLVRMLFGDKEFEEGRFIMMGTLRGVVKKTELSAFSNPRAGGIIAMGVEDGDRLMAAQITDGTGEIFIGSRDGMGRIFATVRSTGCTDERAQEFIAQGMLLNVMLSIGAPEHLDESPDLEALVVCAFGDALPFVTP